MGPNEPSPWQDLHSEPLCISTYFGLHGFVNIFQVYPFISLWKLMTLSVYVANLDSRGIRMVGTIYVEDHQTLLYTRYISCGPHGYRKDDFKFFSIICLRVIDPKRAWPVFIERIYVRDH